MPGSEDRPSTVWGVVACEKCGELVKAKCDACGDALLCGHPMVCRETASPREPFSLTPPRVIHTHLHIFSCTQAVKAVPS